MITYEFSSFFVLRRVNDVDNNDDGRNNDAGDTAADGCAYHSYSDGEIVMLVVMEIMTMITGTMVLVVIAVVMVVMTMRMVIVIILVEFSIVVRRHHDHSNSFTKKTI